MKLVVVESPTKTKTFAKVLNPKQYHIASTMGHIRDLPLKKLGINLEKNFEPDYEIMPSKKDTVASLIKEAQSADTVILATDPDREGEAIAYHLSVILKDALKKKKLRFERIVFHEITPEALTEALKNPRELNEKLFHAQQARRVLDRLVGYQVSPYLWKRFSKQWLSAGRVQTIALRFLVARFKERADFAARDYFFIRAVFKQGAQLLEAKLIELKGAPFYQTTKINLFDGTYQYQESLLSAENEALREEKRLKAESYTVSAVVESTHTRLPNSPFTTSLMQQYGANYLGMSAKKTMQIAQSLYEQGAITYHRTDSLTLSEKFIAAARQYIEKMHGKEYLNESVRRYKTTSKLAQEAHEAIRPTQVANTPDKMSSKLSRDQLRLYRAIYNRAVAAQMKEARILKQKIIVTSDAQDVFAAENERVLFPGFLILSLDEEEIKKDGLKTVQEHKKINLKEFMNEKKQTMPPPHYTEASIIKTLEERGIGRPSTYAPILSLIQERQYVKKEGKSLIATELGIAICDVLVEHFHNVFDVDFTARMENKLDEVAVGEKQWTEVVRELHDPLTKDLEKASRDITKIRVEEKTDEKCPQCGRDVVIKTSRFGKFYACTGFPDCRYTKPFFEPLGIKCPKCGTGDVIMRFSRKRKRFYACNRYPDCDFTSLWPPKKSTESETKEDKASVKE